MQESIMPLNKRGRMIFSSLLSGGSGGGFLFNSLLQIPYGNVNSDLNNFVTMVDLSDMPSGFWSNVKSDGGDVRVKNNDIVIPHDLVYIDTDNQKGLLFFKYNLSSTIDNDFNVCCGNSELEKLPATDDNGRNAVWSDYSCVFDFFEDTDRTGNGSSITKTNISDKLMLTDSSPDTGCHQGICFDGTYFYTIDTDRIIKWDSGWNQVDISTTAIADSSISGVDHLGDADIYNGELYVPLEKYPNSPYDNQHIAVYSATDLSFIRSYDISSEGREVSSIAYNPDDGLLYITDYTNGASVMKYQLNGTYVGVVTLSQTINAIQGVTFWNGFMWLSTHSSGSIYKFQTNGTLVEKVYHESSGITEGIHHTDDEILCLIDNGTRLVRYFKPLDIVYPNWAGFTQDGRIKIEVPKFTSWTMGASLVISSKGGINNSILSYTALGSSNSGYRSSLVRRNSPDTIQLWNSSDSWLSTAYSSPALNTKFRVVTTHDGTTKRELFVDGSSVGSDVGCSQRPGSTGDGLYIGCQDETSSGSAEYLNGAVNFVYLKEGILSDDWILAEHLSWHDPNNFYSIT
jgi:hypothetical protein